MLTLTKDELVDDLSDVLSDTCDMDMPWSSYAKAVVNRLVALGVDFPRAVDALCPSCGRDASVQYGGSCGRGGCPFGADL